jgi:hypothetical protein
MRTLVRTPAMLRPIDCYSIARRGGTKALHVP